MIREWIKRRYVEADYRLLEAEANQWWNERLIDQRMRVREFWAWLGGRA